MRILDDIIGKEIIDSTATIIGKVKDIEIDTASNTVESLIITKGGLGRNLRQTKEETFIPFEMIQKVGDKIILKKTIEEELNID